MLKASSPSKVSLEPHSAFGLPAKLSCPGLTPACSDLCYALKARYAWDSVTEPRRANLDRLRQLKLDRNQPLALAELAAAVPVNKAFFRIHDSGDFFSQWYVDLWCQLVRSRAHTTFWAYTRSFTFEYRPFLRLCPNMTLWASTDGHNFIDAVRFVHDHKHYGVRHAWWPKESFTPADAITCPATNGRIPTAGACEKCKLCLNRPDHDIAFDTH